MGTKHSPVIRYVLRYFHKCEVLFNMEEMDSGFCLTLLNTLWTAYDHVIHDLALGLPHTNWTQFHCWVEMPEPHHQRRGEVLYSFPPCVIFYTAQDRRTVKTWPKPFSPVIPGCDPGEVQTCWSSFQSQCGTYSFAAECAPQLSNKMHFVQIWVKTWTKGDLQKWGWAPILLL